MNECVLVAKADCLNRNQLLTRCLENVRLFTIRPNADYNPHTVITSHLSFYELF